MNLFAELTRCMPTAKKIRLDTVGWISNMRVLALIAFHNLKIIKTDQWLETMVVFDV